MNMIKSKPNRVFIISLLSVFAAVAVHANTGKRSLFAENYGPAAADHSLAARYLAGNEETSAETAKDLLDTDKERTLKQILAGIGGNVVGLYGMGMLGYALSSKGHDENGALFLGGVIGSAFGSALGVYLAGNSKTMRGNFGSALLGSSFGVLVSIGSIRAGGIIAILSSVILPPVGAIIFFNSSLRPRSISAGNGLFNLSEGKLGLGVPDIQVSPLPVYGKNMKTELQFKINMLSVVL